MTDPATRRVMDALRAKGADVRFVGGCVRDAVLKRPVADIDIATPDRPETVVELLEAAGIKAVPTGIKHGTVTAVAGGKPFEITTLRLDLATDGRHAKVAYTDDWIADAARRDFTINAMSCTPEGDIYDPFHGLADLGAEIVRFVGVPRQRIEEDYLRLLRFFRMYATYGAPPPDAEALAACHQLAPNLVTLSAERIRAEILRILVAPNAADTVALMRGERILEQILPEAENLGRLRMVCWLETTAIRLDSVAPDPIRRLASLLGGDPGDAAAVADRLRLSKREAARLKVLAAPSADLSPTIGMRSVHAAIYRFGVEAARDWLLLAWAGEMAVEPRRESGRSQAWIALLEATETWKSPRFPLTGKDVTAQGVPKGPRVGELLEAVESWWIGSDFAADRDACIGELRNRI